MLVMVQTNVILDTVFLFINVAEKVKGTGMCNQCITKAPFGQPRYYRAPNQKCLQCNETITTVLLIIVFVFALMIAGYAMMWVSKKGKNFGSVRILIDYFQILFIFGSFKLQWPDFVANQMQFFSFAMFNIEMATPSCLAPDFGYLQIFVLMMVTPIIFIGGLALSSILMTPPFNVPFIKLKNVYLKFRQKKEITIEGKWNMEVFKKNVGQAIRATNLFLQFAFASLVGWSLGYFNCQSLNGREVSYKDPQLECGVGDHKTFSGLAVFGLIFYMVGIPLWLGALFYFQRQKRFNSAFFVYMRGLSAGLLNSEKCSFNYQHHPFVIVQMLTKAILIFAQMYFKTFNVLQGLFVQISMLIYTGFLLYMKPYKNPNDNIVDMAAQVSSIITLCAGILFYNAKTEGIKGLDALGGVVMAIIWCSLIGIVTVIGYDIRTKRKEAQKKKEAGGAEEGEGDDDEGDDGMPKLKNPFTKKKGKKGVEEKSGPKAVKTAEMNETKEPKRVPKSDFPTEEDNEEKKVTEVKSTPPVEKKIQQQQEPTLQPKTTNNVAKEKELENHHSASVIELDQRQAPALDIPERTKNNNSESGDEDVKKGKKGKKGKKEKKEKNEKKDDKSSSSSSSEDDEES